MSTHGFLWPYSISGLIRKYIDSITAWWQANWEEEGEKGQHIFENVNLNHVFWVCWKKAIIKCHLGPTAPGLFFSLSFSFPWAMGIVTTCSTLRSDFPIVWSCYMRSHFTGGACLLGYVCALYRYLSCTEKMFCCFDSLAAVFPLHKSKDVALRV